jgi:GT2 family glycosyltransferase
MSRVVALIINFNSGNRLESCVRSLLASVYTDLQILVIDNASPRDRESLERVARLVPVIRRRANIGFGRACNAAARDVTADYLIFLNPDVEVTPDWISPLVAAFDADADLAIVSPTTLYPYEPQSDRTGMSYTATVPGCSMMVRRSAWEKLGGFDESFFLYWEDTDLCWRAWSAGWKVAESFDSIVYHDRGGSSGAELWAAEQIRNGIRTYLKTMRWRKVFPFLAKSVIRTMIVGLRDRDVNAVSAWIWNARYLGESLRVRRDLSIARKVEPRFLEELIAAHRERQLRERKERRSRPSSSVVVTEE